MELEVGADLVCCMQAEDVDYSQGWSKEHIVECDHGSKVTPDVGFSFVEAEQW